MPECGKTSTRLFQIPNPLDNTPSGESETWKKRMLVSFTVENFRSFRAEQTLSLVADTRQQDHNEHLRSLPAPHHNRLLPLGLVFGANGSGKSNLVKAIASLRDAVLHEARLRRKSMPFKFDKASALEPITLSVRFVAGSVVYDYGFSEDADGIKEEWFYSVGPDGDTKEVFERDREGGLRTGPQLQSVDHEDKIAALVTLGTKKTQLFATAVKRNLDRELMPAPLGALIDFLEGITIIAPDTQPLGLLSQMSKDPDLRQHVSDVLRSSDTGVADIEVDRIPLDDASPFRQIIDKLTSDEEFNLPSGAAEVSIAGPQGEFTIDVDGEVTQLVAHAQHLCVDGELRRLELREESDGTLRLLQLAPSLSFETPEKAKLLIVDELDRSLHPILARSYLRLLLEALVKSGSQAIITTHESYLLTQELLRRDEVWFAEKSPRTLETCLSSLSEFSIRNNLRLQKGYLSGRFGGIPVLRDLDFSNESEPERQQAVEQ